MKGISRRQKMKVIPRINRTKNRQFFSSDQPDNKARRLKAKEIISRKPS